MQRQGKGFTHHPRYTKASLQEPGRAGLYTVDIVGFSDQEMVHTEARPG